MQEIKGAPVAKACFPQSLLRGLRQLIQGREGKERKIGRQLLCCVPLKPCNAANVQIGRQGVRMTQNTLPSSIEIL